MPNPVMHFELIAKDAPALREFYRTVFGWTIDAPTQGAGLSDYTVVHPNAKVGIDGGIGTAPPDYEGHCTVYIAVDDIEKTLAEIEKRGGRRMMPATQIPNGPTIALFTDPGGFTMGLVRP